ncbi:hypothetical protein OEZ85_005492 [Tetradesmus obliquus]|uniref:AF4/FMR2 family member 4-like n=1 Tax=Tetradesmus obliquus TaxID=3088 RepID=A0ABY8UEE8_TETOB|nr:hypothetical protein OEZ85_005492 [Tetradesmus obliquus]
MASSSSLHDGAPSPLDSALLHLAGAALQYLEAELSQASTVGAAAAPAAGAGSWLPAAPGSEFIGSIDDGAWEEEEEGHALLCGSSEWGCSDDGLVEHAAQQQPQQQQEPVATTVAAGEPASPVQQQQCGFFTSPASTESAEQAAMAGAEAPQQSVMLTESSAGGQTSEQGVSAAPSFAEEGKAAVAGPAVLASEPTCGSTAGFVQAGLEEQTNACCSRNSSSRSRRSSSSSSSSNSNTSPCTADNRFEVEELQQEAISTEAAADTPVALSAPLSLAEQPDQQQQHQHEELLPASRSWAAAEQLLGMVGRTQQHSPDRAGGLGAAAPGWAGQHTCQQAAARQQGAG